MMAYLDDLAADYAVSRTTEGLLLRSRRRGIRTMILVATPADLDRWTRAHVSSEDRSNELARAITSAASEAHGRERFIVIVEDEFRPSTRADLPPSRDPVPDAPPPACGQWQPYS